MHVVNLAAYDGPYEGSFVPMLERVCEAVVAGGGSSELVFGTSAQGRGWVERLEAADRRVRFAPLSDWRATTEWLRREMPQLRPETIVHTHFTRFDIPAVRALRRPGVSLVWHAHTVPGCSAAARLRVLAKHRGPGRRVGAFACAGDQLMERLQAAGAPAGRLVSLPTAIDSERFSPPDSARRAAARTALGIEPDRLVLLHFGWDWQVKGGDLLLGAIAKLGAERRSRLTVLCVGAGDPGRAEIARYGLDDQVRVLEPLRAVTDYYSAADILVAPSRHEGGSPPFAVLEALASGLEVIASDIPAHRGAADSLAAMRIVAGRIDPLAEALEAADPSAAGSADRRLQSRRWIVAERNLDAYAGRVLALYEHLIAAGVR